MLTHFIRSINWIDVCLICLFLRMIYVGVKNGFVAEFFKFLGVVVAVYVSLHYYSSLAAWCFKTNILSITYWNAIVFGSLWALVLIVFKFLRDGVLVLFKIETNHEGFNQYAAGILACFRGILVCSLTIFLLLLLNMPTVSGMTRHSYSFKVAGRAAVGTYSVLFNNLASKFWVNQHENEAVYEVVHRPK